MIEKLTLGVISNLNTKGENAFKKYPFDFLLSPGAQVDYESISLFYKKKFLKSAVSIIKAVELYGLTKERYINLGYLISHYIEVKDLDYLIGMLEPLDLRCTQLLLKTKLVANALLKSDSDESVNYINVNYINKFVSSYDGNKGFKNRLYYLHIPKCGGTSYFRSLAHKIYGENYSLILPSIADYYLLKYCAANCVSSFPLLSSQHHRLDAVSPSEEYNVIGFYRDPYKRAISMYRQSYRAIKLGYHLKIIPRYGDVWDYWGPLDVDNWLERCPEVSTNAQLSTFSSSLDVAGAVGVAKKIRFYGDLNNGNDEFLTVVDKLGFPLKRGDISTGLNKSPMKPVIDPTSCKLIKKRLNSEYNFIQSLKGL